MAIKRKVKHRNRWSQKVTQSSNALDLEAGVFSLDDPRQIAQSLQKGKKGSLEDEVGVLVDCLLLC